MNAKKIIIRRTYSVFHNQKTDRVAYISVPISAIGKEAETENPNDAYMFQPDDPELLKYTNNAVVDVRYVKNGLSEYLQEFCDPDELNGFDNHIKAYTGSEYDFDNEIMLGWYPKRILQITTKEKAVCQILPDAASEDGLGLHLIANMNNILELGIGHGITAYYFGQTLQDLHQHHVILEGSANVIDNFKKKYPKFENFCNRSLIVKTTFEEFESDAKFDVIVLGFVLEHVDDPVLIMKKYIEYLSPNGQMFIAVPNADVLNRRLGHLAGMLKDTQALSKNDLLLGHKRYYTIRTLRDDITKAGCDIKRMEGVYLKPFTTNQIKSLNLDTKVIDALCEVGIDYPELCCGLLAEVVKSK
jgi:SAM-dependent methyltransferase